MATHNFATDQATGTNTTGTNLNECVQQDAADAALKKGDGTVVTVATQAVAEAGTDTNPRPFSPQRVMQAVALPSMDTMGFLWSYNSTTSFDVSGGKRQYKDNSATFKIADQTGLSMSSAFGAGGVLSSSLTFTAGVSYFVHACDNAGTAAIIVDNSPTGATAVSDHGVTIAFTFFGFLAAAGPVIPTLRTHLTDGGNNYALLDVMSLDSTTTGATGSRAAAVMSVPTGVRVRADIHGRLSDPGTSYAILTETVQTDSAPTNVLNHMETSSTASKSNCDLRMLTDTSGQINYRTDVVVVGLLLFLRGYEFFRS